MAYSFYKRTIDVEILLREIFISIVGSDLGGKES